MLVGPTKVLFMDEISNGLDSSTAYQIVSCLQQLAQVTDATILVSLLQPAPETFNLFDDIILMAEGRIVYQGPRDDVLEFFDSCGFKCPIRKGVADFLQEASAPYSVGIPHFSSLQAIIFTYLTGFQVLSTKDQEQYWHKSHQTYSYISVDMFLRKYKESPHGYKLTEELSVPFDKSKSNKNAISFSMYSLKKWALFRACMSRELLLMKRNSFIYIFKSVQVSQIILSTPYVSFKHHKEHQKPGVVCA